MVSVVDTLWGMECLTTVELIENNSKQVREKRASVLQTLRRNKQQERHGRDEEEYLCKRNRVSHWWNCWW